MIWLQHKKPRTFLLPLKHTLRGWLQNCMVNAKNPSVPLIRSSVAVIIGSCYLNYILTICVTDYVRHRCIVHPEISSQPIMLITIKANWYVCNQLGHLHQIYTESLCSLQHFPRLGCCSHANFTKTIPLLWRRKPNEGTVNTEPWLGAISGGKSWRLYSGKPADCRQLN